MWFRHSYFMACSEFVYHVFQTDRPMSFTKFKVSKKTLGDDFKQNQLLTSRGGNSRWTLNISDLKMKMTGSMKL